MKIVNFKINKFKIILVIIIIIAILFLLLALSRFLNLTKNKELIMTDENYTEILKSCHENINDYIGKDICTVGYIFRASDLKENEFVIARDMLINKSEAQIVGFLACYENANLFEDNMWVEVKGKIIKGDYHGDIPIIQIKNIKRITTPDNIFVYPPKA